MNKQQKPITGFEAGTAKFACNFRPKSLVEIKGNLFFDVFMYPQEKLQIIYANIRV